ncbi:hypothetical protein FXB38_13680 [Bradyrhizobium cytisi]|uniref:Glycine zipper 2TM domain-containing protein n=2 Tax=Bradyrhizobium cytisi TaxID=515489 RepID=A0A5S4X5B3_9BRAD|nr:hypothetical protein FXB38_13680 [Bradyrhizobium cytisi]
MREGASGKPSPCRTRYSASIRRPERNGLTPCDLILRSASARRTIMKAILAITCLSVLALASPAEAKGCIKGAIVGGVAGHMAGHGKLGAAAGCAIGHHEANKPNPNNSNAQVPSGQK